MGKSRFEYGELKFLAANIRKEQSRRLVSEHRAGHAPLVAWRWVSVGERSSVPIPATISSDSFEATLSRPWRKEAQRYSAAARLPADAKSFR